MTSADFSYAKPVAQRPPQVRHLSFDLSLLHIQLDTITPTGFVKMCSLTRVKLPRYAVPVRQYRSLQSRFLHCKGRPKPACGLLCAFRIRTAGTCTLWIIKLNSHLECSCAILGTHRVDGLTGFFTDEVRLSHHCTYGSRIQRFIKLWRYFFVIGK